MTGCGGCLAHEGALSETSQGLSNTWSYIGSQRFTVDGVVSILDYCTLKWTTSFRVQRTRYLESEEDPTANEVTLQSRVGPEFGTYYQMTSLCRIWNRSESEGLTGIKDHRQGSIWHYSCWCPNSQDCFAYSRIDGPIRAMPLQILSLSLSQKSAGAYFCSTECLGQSKHFSWPVFCIPIRSWYSAVRRTSNTQGGWKGKTPQKSRSGWMSELEMRKPEGKTI